MKLSWTNTLLIFAFMIILAFGILIIKIVLKV